jgi:hypothetical protein
MTDQLFEHAVHDWLDDGSDRTPATAIEAVLLAVKTTPQERVLRIPRRFIPMTTSLRLAALIAIVAIAGVGAVILTTGRSSTPPTPSESPIVSAAPSPTTGAGRTDDWIAYTSERYGFDIKRHPEFVETPATTYWDIADADVFPAPGTEDFYFANAGAGDGLGVRVSAWSWAVEPGTSLDTFIEAYCTESGGSTCATILDTAQPATTLDGDEGVSIAGFNLDSQVFVLVDDRVYIVTAWRTDNDPSVVPFGGGRQLVEDFASTMTLRPAGPAPDVPAPALPGSFTSERYGYSIDFPEDFWTATGAAELWAPGTEQDLWSDTFLPPSTNNGFRAASAVIPTGVIVDDWIAENVTGVPGDGGECAPVRATLGDIVIYGQTGKVRMSCEEIEATLVLDDRLYLFTLFLDVGAPYDIAGSRALFEAMMATVTLTPETAVEAPTPSPS